ncbi:chromosome segregation protein SMC [Lacticaseibacillus nasuensis]|uniref:chromosome segregation protein SMC n=1 Tax=Lacticaseibacillus nasuensis TaxID=944671 RepID=UPI0022482EC4|nr:chromosome segregation protein SMC [Lacticaseibacillus nasuensis]MCX2455960.1 chromosome segregation protein SMC [Lacticaseibacillus nasuensis]
MQLKQLTINGFKSFADKTTIEFVSGLTGIVGPNGSGKSNITEAIRWALGEQSAKSLRGEKMGDVIFAGTANRPPLNRAEVVMTFDNSDGYLKEQPATVAITRRLYRDGESDFLINNQAVRLKDIVDLFMDSGLGKESFSFISQGRVEAIFNSKPEERRGILEEAAGVLKYKQQKTKAERELATTDDNLDRVNDIIQELHRQLAPLEEQASLARDFEQQTGEYQQIHKQILALEIQQFAAEQEQTQAANRETKQIVAAQADRAKSLEAKSEALTQTEDDLERELNQLNDDILAKSMRLEGLTGEANLSSERVSNAQSTLAELKDQLASATSDRKAAEAQVQTLTDQVAAQTTKRAALAKALKDQQAAAHAPAQLNEQLDAAQNHYIDLLQQQATNKNALAATEKDQELAARQSSADATRLHGLQQAAAEAKATAAAQATKVADLTSQLATASATLDEAQDRLTAAREAQAGADTAYRDHVAEFQRAKARYETLSELKEDYSGFYAGVRAVLKHKANLTGVIGAVAELLTVPAKYQQAMDVALGANLQAVVTTDETAAREAITYLKQTRAGRATFLPVSVIRPRQLPAAVQRQLAEAPGFIGVGSDLVQADQAVQNVVANLLGSLIVADTLANGVKLANLSGHRYRIVTLDGDILSPGGAMTGGHAQRSGVSPLARTQEAARLKQTLADMVPALQREKAALDDKTAAVATATTAVTAAQATSTRLTADLRAASAQRDSLAEQATQAARQAQAAKLAADATTDFATKLTTLQHTATELAAAIAQAQATITNTKEQLNSATAAEAEYQAQLNQRQTALAVLTTEWQTAKTQLQQWQDQAAQLAQQVKTLTARIARITRESADTAEEKANREATIKRLNSELTTLKARQDQQAKAKAANHTTLSEVSAQISTAYAKQNAAMATAEQQAASLSRLKLNLENRLATLAEDYQLSFEAAQQLVTQQPAELPAMKSKLKLLKRGLDDLGPVNPNAIAEYDNVKQRYEFLHKQQTDLLDAKAQLLATMGELDEEVKVRFKDMFDQTNAAFQEIFPKMFGGGHAHLSLTDPDDLLNTGLEISAEPPGKKLQRLSLLSGGERALTAIVLLFAILQVRPVPFSILDEVEASLDDVNVNRFGEFLKHYSSDTQFIVITHRRGTMLAANMLYGVTMQESGVSKMMAVSLDQLAKPAASHPKEDEHGVIR